MTNYIVTPSKLSGSITASASKSHTMRAILFASMARGESIIDNVLPSPDTAAMIVACRQLGAVIEKRDEGRLEITGFSGNPRSTDNIIDAGNSGQVLRFIACLGALNSSYTIITGDESIRTNRPLQPLVEALPYLGVSCETMRGDGFAPIIIKGPMRSGQTQLSGEDSQPVSGLMIAATLTEGDTVIEVEPVGELPWLQVTLSWFDRLGLPYQNECYKRFTIPGKNMIDGFNYRVVGDFSSIAFPVVAALITHSAIEIDAVDMRDQQGDKRLISVLQEMGAHIDYDEQQQRLSVHPSPVLTGMNIDINDMIDAITILAVVGCFAKGKTRLHNAKIARSKECDRISAIATELSKMGAAITEHEDGLTIEHSPLHGATVDTYHDHRMVMSLTVAALAATGSSQINNIACVSKSYPSFCEDLKKLGCSIEQVS